MTPNDYKDTYHFILRNLAEITRHANDETKSEQFSHTFRKMQEELDYWHGFKERVDLNFLYEDGKIVCYAYPVVNAVPNYDQVWAVEVPINMSKNLEEQECHYCGQSDSECDYTVRKPYEFEPAMLVCEDCMEEQPWK